MARRGEARHGMAGRGEAGQGKDTLGRLRQEQDARLQWQGAGETEMNILPEFRSLRRGHQIVVFTTVTIAFPFICVWTLFGEVKDGIRSGLVMTRIEWRGMCRQYRQLWN